MPFSGINLRPSISPLEIRLSKYTPVWKIEGFFRTNTSKRERERGGGGGGGKKKKKKKKG